MTAPEATLIASGVAAVATLLTLIVTVLNKRREEMRTAHRDVIAEDLKRIGKAIHEVMALSNIQLKLLNKPQHGEKYQLAAEAARRLKDTRMDVRYTLWGLDEGFRALARLPDWVGHAKVEESAAVEIFEIAKRLGTQLDLAVRDAYVNGRAPSRWRTYRVNREASRLRDRYNRFAATRQ
jgi:hypothetical protein